MFLSIGFLLFFGVMTGLFFMLPVRWRPVLLLTGSYLLCGFLDMQALLVLVGVSLYTWKAGMVIKKQKAFLILTVCLGITMLAVYKYVPFKSLVMPVGLSFYLFQAIGYLVDVYRGKTPAERSFLYLSCHLAYFPKLVSGPIEREQDFLPQLKAVKDVKFYDRGRLSTAFAYMLWGYFMKMVVADRLAMTVNQIFVEPEVFDSLYLAIGAFLYTIQIYCDFAGYSYIAIGCSLVFGIRLAQNFKAPYCAENITDFWRRWHVSLSTWLRDYLYIPLGGNQKGIARKCLNTIIVFLVCGMWHGVGFQFVVWGLLHGIYSVIDTLIRKARWKIRGGRIWTFLAVAFAWIFFRAESLGAAMNYVIRMFTAGISPAMWKQYALQLSLGKVEISVIIACVIIIWLADEFCDSKKLHLPVLLQQKENAARYFVFYVLIVAIFIFGMYGPGYHAEQFIYMQF